MTSTKRIALSAVAVIAVAASASAAQATAVMVAGTTQAGTLWAWGSNFRGDLGDGTTDNRDLPVIVSVPGGSKVRAAAAGLSHSVALTKAGRVLAWGNNFDGELGNGTTLISHVPVPVSIPAGRTITAVQAGCYDSMALTSAGQVLAWGRNAFGELGDGTRTNSDVPVLVDLPAATTVTAISAGCYFNLALTATGQVLAWGRDDNGQLGRANGASSLRPILVKFPTAAKIAAISAGVAGGVAVTATGQVYTWGATPAHVPMPPKSLVGTVTTVAAGAAFYLALTSRGVVLAWGENGNGQLGDGTDNSASLPVKVRLPSNLRALAISAATATGFALTTSGQVLGWGSGAALADGGGPDTDIPLRMELAGDSTAVGAGSSAIHAFAILR